MRPKMFVLACLAALGAFAQETPPNLEEYTGPGILSRPIGDVGSRSGQELGLRYYLGASGVYDSGLLPLARDADGNLTRVQPLYGVEARYGAYGVHNWRYSKLGLDYTGNYRHYTNTSGYDGSDNLLDLGWSYQQSRRISFDFHQRAGTYARTMGVITTAPSSSTDFTPAGQFIDSRTNYLRSSVDALIQQSLRTYYVLSASAYLTNRRATYLTDLKGYTLSGSVSRRVTRFYTAGARYGYDRQYIPQYSTDVNSHTFEGTFEAQFGPYWTLSARGGVFLTAVDSTTVLNFGPPIGPLLVKTYQQNVFPSAYVMLRRQMKQAHFQVEYTRSIGVGNGLTNASRLETGRVGLSYSGIRRWNFGIDSGYYGYSNIAAGIGNSQQLGAGAGFTYDIVKATHLSVRYDYRHVNVATTSSYNPDASRVSIGLFFSPGQVPLSLW